MKLVHLVDFITKKLYTNLLES